MPHELPSVLVWGLPGLAVWLVGEGLMLRTARTGRTSPVARRVARVGFVVLILGVMVGLASMFTARGQAIIGLAAIVVLGSLMLRALRPVRSRGREAPAHPAAEIEAGRRG